MQGDSGRGALGGEGVRGLGGGGVRRGRGGARARWGGIDKRLPTRLEDIAVELPGIPRKGKKGFKAIIDYIAEVFGDHLFRGRRFQFSPTSVTMLHDASDGLISKMFERANHVAEAHGRKTVGVADIEAVRRIFGEKADFYSTYSQLDTGMSFSRRISIPLCFPNHFFQSSLE